MTIALIAVILAILTSPIWLPLLMVLLFWLMWACWSLLALVETTLINMKNFFLKLRRS